MYMCVGQQQQGPSHKILPIALHLPRPKVNQWRVSKWGNKRPIKLRKKVQIPNQQHSQIMGQKDIKEK